MKRLNMFIIALLSLLTVNLYGEQVKVGTYNVEHFMRMFDQQQMPERSRDMTEFYRDDEDQYEVARVINLPQYDPDIICIQECCNQEMLEEFNKEQLGGKYSFVKVFNGNSDSQMLAMMAKKGFEPVKIDEYYQMKDKDYRDGTNDLFGRGPAFVKFKTPKGNYLWVGTTHVKSKYNDSANIVRWRSRQVTTLRSICEDYIKSGGDYVIIQGDFNDGFGMDSNENKAGMDAVAQLLLGERKMHCVTKKLQDDGLNSYHCKIKPPKYRSFLDHVFVSEELVNKVINVKMIDDPIAEVASDHLPVVVTYNLPE